MTQDSDAFSAVDMVIGTALPSAAASGQCNNEKL